MPALASASVTLASAVAADATFTLSYPAGSTQASLTGCSGGKMVVNGDGVYAEGTSGFTVAYGASLITVTNKTGASLAAGSVLTLSFGRSDASGRYTPSILVPGPTALTDSTGGTASNTIAAITAGSTYAQADMTATKNALASLAAKVNEIITALENSKVTN